MRAIDVIVDKRDKKTLSKEQIVFFVKGITDGSIADYQISAWAMAVLLNGMTDRETTYLTMAMAESGEELDLSKIAPIVVDKHSTGGVGDKTSLVVAPLVASFGLPVGKMSGRGLGFSGGTLDKLESIPGYRVDLTKDEFMKQLDEIGIVLTGQTADLAPADGKLYSIRDVTGTVPSLPLIASSIMSKKIAAGAHAIVLDVKVGNGAFMKNLEDARHLSKIMVTIGKLCGSKTVAILSDMNQPLGAAVGNAVELNEAIETLQGGGPEDFKEHCLVIASHMLYLGKKFNSLDEARKAVEKAIEEKDAWEKFKQLVEAQGGDLEVLENPDRLPRPNFKMDVKAEKAGYIAEVHARKIGETAVELGAGREKKGQPIDHSVGILIHVKVGDMIEENEPLFSILAKNASDAEEASIRLLDSLSWSKEKVEPLPLFYDVIE